MDTLLFCPFAISFSLAAARVAFTTMELPGATKNIISGATESISLRTFRLLADHVLRRLRSITSLTSIQFL